MFFQWEPLRHDYNKGREWKLWNQDKPENSNRMTNSLENMKIETNSKTKSAAESAEVLADSFSSVFVLEPESLPYGMLLVDTNEVLTEIAITCEDVRYELKNLNCFKSVGPDSIYPKL